MIDEFFDVLELKDNPIIIRIIKVFNKNDHDKISFYEFVWGLSTLTSEAKLEEKRKIAFQIYDMKGDGFISSRSLFNCLIMLVGDN